MQKVIPRVWYANNVENIFFLKFQQFQHVFASLLEKIIQNMVALT